MKINLLNKINKKFKELIKKINIIIYKKLKINKNKLIIIVKKNIKKFESTEK